LSLKRLEFTPIWRINEVLVGVGDLLPVFRGENPEHFAPEYFLKIADRDLRD
jgi:hypothetical protein